MENSSTPSVKVRYLFINYSLIYLQVITQRLEFDSVDDSLKGCWSCLWNVTDEAPANSERFIRHNGVDLFLKCLNKFPEDTELKRNIMGLVGKILCLISTIKTVT